MRAQRDGIREAAVAAGRDPDAITMLFVVNPIPTANAAETDSVRSARAELTQAAIDEQLQSISYLTNVDFAAFDLDEPLPSFETNSNRGTLDNFMKSAPAGSTLREVLAARAKADGLAIVGTPTEITDRLGELAEGSGADGFLFTGQVHPAHVHRTLDPLVPALRDAGLLQRELPATTLRGNLAAR
jgi:alkanesulfonate monooxygenase SsuD/methylene tetrahydromethanopterin reductase-like flavin-dependent oxidoreductase (luciferase family)